MKFGQFALAVTVFAALCAGDTAAVAGGGVAVLGPDAPACGATANGAAFLVQVSNFKSRSGTVRVRLFGGDPATYFDREHALVRTQLPVPANGIAAICVPAPAPGVYAIDVRHDVNGNDVTDRGDGGGMSGNPRVTLWDVLFRRRPSPKLTQVAIERGVKSIPIQVRYL